MSTEALKELYTKYKELGEKRFSGFEKMSQIQEILGKVREGLKKDHAETERGETLIVEVSVTRWMSERLTLYQRELRKQS